MNTELESALDRPRRTWRDALTWELKWLSVEVAWVLTCLALLVAGDAEWADVGGALFFALVLLSLCVRFRHYRPADTPRGRTRWLLGLMALAVLVLAGGAAWYALRPVPPIHDFYARVRPGMTRPEVEAVFGDWWTCPRRSTRSVYTLVEGNISNGGGMVVTWDWYDRAVLLRFDDQGRVREKGFATVPWQAEPWPYRLRRALGLL